MRLLRRVSLATWILPLARLFARIEVEGREHLEGRMIFDAPLRAWLWEFLDVIFERDHRAS